MPTFLLKWTNRSNVDQDWMVYPPADNFTLHRDYTRNVNITLNANHAYQIAVSTENSFAAASLTYTALTNTWTLNSHTPNEFELSVLANTVRLSCSLTVRAIAVDDASEYDPQGMPAVDSKQPASIITATAKSIFTTGALDRQILLAAKSGLAGKVVLASDPGYDQKPWSLLYEALKRGLGVDPSNFQLTYPFTSWDWPTQQVGFIGGAQYDFCSTIPQWSAVGAYTSGGDRLHQAYQEFLNIISAATDDPVLRQKIVEAFAMFTAASNAYTIAYNQALSVYNDIDPKNKPDFTAWLGTPAGKGWQTQIVAAQTKLDQTQVTYNALVDQANTPGLADALAQFKNTDYYSKLNDPGLATFPRLPNYSISQNPRQWVDRIKAGTGPAGGTIGFNNRDSSYNYSETWAKGSASIRQLFWQVQVNGEWKRITEFETDQQLNVSVEFQAVDTVSIQPSDWFNASFVKSKANGPFKYGYSAYGDNGTQAIFGPSGFFGLMKTGMYVAYKPTFTITTSSSSFDSFLNSFKVATGLRIGPFTFGASGGSTQAGWNASKAGQSFTGTSTSDSPLIVGVTIAQIPKPPDAEAGNSMTNAPDTGVCYRFSDCHGDVVANNVTKQDCFGYLGGQSWRKNGATRCWEN